MASRIEELLEKIANAVYGIDVRDAIHDSIEECYSDVSSAKTLADAATSAANTAAANANTKATLADTKATAANTAAASANSAASSATSAASSANTAAGRVETSISAANQATIDANSAASSANTAAGSATTAAATANSAASAANTAAANATTAKENADTATSAANTAAGSANEAATAANAAASAANSAKTAADTAAAAATEAATNASEVAEDVGEAVETATAAAERANAAAESVTEAIESAAAATSAANTAVSNANDARDAANTAAGNANSAVTLANTAISNANSAASSANTAAETANTAASNANDKASTAELAASTATLAASDANSARTAANTAAANADEKAADAEQAATTANTAANSANTAAGAANQAVTRANEAIGNVNTAISDSSAATYSATVAATNASTAAGRANEAAEAIDGMTVTSENVGPNASAEAVISEVSGHKNIHFKLRQGANGASYIIKGNAYATLSDLEADISSPAIGDQYNVGSAAPYNVYRWTGTKWEDQGQIGISLSGISDTEIDTVYSGGTPESTSGKYLDLDGLVYLITQKVLVSLADKVDKISGKGLSTNDFTTAYKNTVDSVEAQTVALASNKVDKVTGKGLSTNDFTTAYKDLVDQNAADIVTLSSGKVDKVSGKGLSTNDFTNAYKAQLDELPYGEQISSGNLNNYTATGTYYILGTDLGNVSNVPYTSGGTMMLSVTKFDGGDGDAESCVWQMAKCVNGEYGLSVRQYTAGSWGSWADIPTAPVGIAYGGTGATTAAGALSAIGAAAASHTHQSIVSAGSNVAWETYADQGMYYIHYEGGSTASTYNVPTNYCDVIVARYSSTRGAAIATRWDGSNLEFWINTMHGSWGGWKRPAALTNLGSNATDELWKASPRPGVTGTLGIGNGGTGLTSMTDLQHKMFGTQTAAGTADSTAVTSYPTSPGLYGVASTFAGLPADAHTNGVLAIMRGGGYRLHIYMDSSQVAYMARTQGNVPSSWRKLTTSSVSVIE